MPLCPAPVFHVYLVYYMVFVSLPKALMKTSEWKALDIEEKVNNLQECRFCASIPVYFVLLAMLRIVFMNILLKAID